MKPRVRRRVAIVGILALAAVAPAACGSGSEEDDYVDRLNEITEVLRDDVSQLSKDGVAVGDPEETAQVYDEFAAEFGQAAAEAAELEPPGEIADLHDRIVDDLESMEMEASNAAEAVRAGGADDIVHVSARLEIDEGRLAADIDGTIQEINAELSG
jgi:hypothetical protein